MGAAARYLALARGDDVERVLALGGDLIARTDPLRGVALLQCGRESPRAKELEGLLRRTGRAAYPLVVQTRAQAQSESVRRKVEHASAVWVFAEDLFEAFLTIFATELAWFLRARAAEGLPVVGVGGGALALGGLFLANRICANASYDLVAGLGWAPRVLFDSGADRAATDAAIARSSVRTLPGLLGVDLGSQGGLKVLGGRVESVGDEPVVLLGADNGRLLMMSLDPGQVATIAPPPFAPFDRGLLPADTLSSLSPELRPAARVLRQAPPPAAEAPEVVTEDEMTHSKPGSGRVCPMCHKVHAADARVSLAA